MENALILLTKIFLKNVVILLKYIIMQWDFWFLNELIFFMILF